jgi:hypothetical protein
MCDENQEKKPYDRDVLVSLWKMKYEDLVEAPSEVGRLREARFVMQARVAWETHRYMRMTTWATVVLAVATVILAMATIILAASPK